jgi:hypothetical protein
MSKEVSAWQAMLDQYEANNKPKYENKTEKVYDLKNYFNTYIKEGIKSATKQVRILPNPNGGSPFIEMHVHKIQVDGEWKTFTCLKHENKEDCPFCEAREALLATGKESDKELAKKYSARKMYVVKVIDREKPEEGVKFWRFAHDYSKNGVYDKIIGVINGIKKDVSNPDNGRDLVLTITRNQNNIPVVTGVASLDPTPLSEDSDEAKAWLSDERTWRDVYALKSYEYLEIIVKGGTPVWDSEEKKFIDKALLNADKEEKSNLESELNLGVENVKSKMVSAPTATKNVEDSVEDDDDDDIPF